MFLTFSKNPRWYTEKKGNQDPKICILVICIICIFRLGVIYIICIFLCWEWGRWVVYLVSVYLVLFCLGLYTWFVYTEIPRVFWALGILFIYLLWCWERDTRSPGF